MAELVGGQAVIEGVMMKRKDKIAIAIRSPNKKILVKKEKSNFPKVKIPFIRGMFALVETLYIGMKSLNFSTKVALQEEGEKSSFYTVIAIILALIFALFLFKFVPLSIVYLIDKLIPLSNITFNLIDGLLKILILVGYIYVISFMKDIQRVFQYHGAEHKAVNCYEAKQPLTVKNVKKFSCLNPRCGTSFIIVVLILSILFYSFIPKDYSFFSKLILRIILLPLIASVAYEFIRLSGKYKNNILLKILSIPGLAIQKMTAKEPEKKQIEVAIKALKAVIN